MTQCAVRNKRDGFRVARERTQLSSEGCPKPELHALPLPGPSALFGRASEGAITPWLRAPLTAGGNCTDERARARRHWVFRDLRAALLLGPMRGPEKRFTLLRNVQGESRGAAWERVWQL